MSSFKMIRISHSEYLSGKYKNVSSDSNNHEAKVWYNSNGSINEELTYSDSYLRSNGLGSYAKKAETSSSKSSSNSSKSSSSSSKSSHSKSSSGSRERTASPQTERTTYVDRYATDEERMNHLVNRLTSRGGYSQYINDAIEAKAKDLGFDADEYIEKAKKQCAKNTQFNIEAVVSRERHIPYINFPSDKKELLECLEKIKEKYKGKKWNKEALFQLEFIIQAYHEHDIELQNTLKEIIQSQKTFISFIRKIKTFINKIKSGDKKTIAITIVVAIIILLLLF